MWKIWIDIDGWVEWGTYDAKYKAELTLDMLDTTYPKRAKRVELVE